MRLMNDTPYVGDAADNSDLLETESNQDDRPQRHLLRKAVAELPDSAIRDMSSRELRFAIRTAGSSLIPPLEYEQLEFADRATLERLVFLTRRACRHRESTANGQPAIPR